MRSPRVKLLWGVLLVVLFLFAGVVRSDQEILIEDLEEDEPEPSVVPPVESTPAKSVELPTFTVLSIIKGIADDVANHTERSFP